MGTYRSKKSNAAPFFTPLLLGSGFFQKESWLQTADRLTLARGWSVMSATRRKRDSEGKDGSDEARNDAAISVGRSTRRNSSEGGSKALSAIDMK